MSKKTNIYTGIRNKYFSGGTIDENFDFDFDTEVKTEEQLENQKQLIDYLLDSPIMTPTKGNVYTLTYVGANDEYLMFEGGFKDYVRVANKPSELKYFKSLKMGDKVDMLIYNINNRTFLIEGSVAQLYESKAHDTIKSLREEDSILALIKEITPAGFNVELQHDSIILPGFMPNTLAGINRLLDPESIVGKTMSVMIESFSREEGTYIVSRKKYLQSLMPEAIKELKQNVVYDGYVTGTTEFGVFVEFNECLTGMIHKSNVDPDWQDRLKQIPAGFEIQFFVKEIIKDSKIILTQILKETLWDSIRINQVITGKIKDNKQFGTLVQLDNETIGLIHTSEVEKTGKTFTEGQVVKVKVIAIDRMNRKIFLSVA